MGTYRVALKAADRAVVRMVAREATGAGGYLHWLKYRQRKEKMPIAVVVGAAPIVMFTGPQKLATDVDEMAVAGGAAGEAIRMTRCRTIDLDVPADSEIVVEGLIDCDVLEPEAPFGESNGYVALEAYNMPIEMTAITHKKKPVFAQIISQVTPSELSVIKKKVAYEPMFLAHLKTQLGVKGIRRVVMHERLTNLRPVISPAIRRQHATHRGLARPQRASTLQSNCGKIVIAVSEDIDPASMDAVLWSLAYRTNPIDDMHIVPNRGGVQGAQYAGNKTDSRPVDATRKRAMPPLALPTREYMEHARGLWEELGLPALNAQAPWHGYTLDDWTDTWETFARRTTAGDGGNRPRDAQAPAPRAVARDAGTAGKRRTGTKRRFGIGAANSAHPRPAFAGRGWRAR